MNVDLSGVDLLSVLPWLRLFKLLSVCAFFTGAIGVLMTGELRAQRRFAFLLAGPGFGLTWTMGFLLAMALRTNLLTTWVLGAIALSLVSIQGVMFVAAREGRRSAGAGLVILLPLIGCAALMVLRPS